MHAHASATTESGLIPVGPYRSSARHAAAANLVHKTHSLSCRWRNVTVYPHVDWLTHTRECENSAGADEWGYSRCSLRESTPLQHITSKQHFSFAGHLLCTPRPFVVALNIPAAWHAIPAEDTFHSANKRSKTNTYSINF